MSFLSLILIAFAMSTDAFAIAVCKGVSMQSPRFIDAIKIGLLFGLIEAITPVLGWLFGYVAADYVEKWDHWIILVLMLFLGLRMIKNSLSADGCDIEPMKESIVLLILAAISTSIDAFAVGVSFAFASVHILLAAGLIGIATALMVTIGIILGKKLGFVIGKRAEFIGGLVLIFIGFWTVFEHVS